MTETKIPTKEEARQAREAIRAFRAAEREKRAARKDRRDERAEEIALHREAEAEAQKMIDAIKSDIDRMDITIGAEQNDIENARKRLATLKDNRAKAMDKLDKQYAERQAARDALKKLNAEIKGTTTPSAKE